MQNRKKTKKGKDSDGEGDEMEMEEIALGDTDESTSSTAVAQLSKAEQQAAELADTPTIPESEISPVAHIFIQQ